MSKHVEEIEYEEITETSDESLHAVSESEGSDVLIPLKIMSVIPTCCKSMHTLRKYDSNEVRNIGRLSYAEGHSDGVMDLFNEIKKKGWHWIAEEALRKLNQSISRQQTLEDE